MATSSGLVPALRRVAQTRGTLDVEANLSVSVDGTDIAVSTVDDRLRVQVPSLRAAIGLFRTERERLPELAKTLDSAGLTAEIRIGGATVAVVGRSANADVLASYLSLGPVELYETGVVAALFRLR